MAPSVSMIDYMVNIGHESGDGKVIVYDFDIKANLLET